MTPSTLVVPLAHPCLAFDSPSHGPRARPAQRRGLQWTAGEFAVLASLVGRYLIKSRYRIALLSGADSAGCGSWGSGPRVGRIGGRSVSPSGADGMGAPSSPFQRGAYWSGCRPASAQQWPVRDDAERLHWGRRAGVPECRGAASYRPGEMCRRAARRASVGSAGPRSRPAPFRLLAVPPTARVITVPSARVNSCRWLRSQWANESSIASASCLKVVVRAAISTRPGLGHRSPVCAPCTNKTVIAR
jgi:hypothetical protein